MEQKKFKVQRNENDEKWGNLLVLSNGIIDLEIPTGIGPRITTFRLSGERNIFYEAPDVKKHFNSEEWFTYGGHRLWHAPELNPRSYYPDNQPVKIEQTENTLAIIQDIEKTTHIQKTIHIHLETDGHNVHIDHILTNKGSWPIELAGWALSVMDINGKAVIPLPEKIPFPDALQPNQSITVWPYSNLDDARVKFSDKFITIDQDPQVKLPLKLGAGCRENWVGYFMNNSVFIKKFNYSQNGRYPDFGCSIEVFTDHTMLEVETLSPMQTIMPGEAIIHREEWQLWKIHGILANDQEISTMINKIIKPAN